MEFNIADVIGAVAAAVPDRDGIVHGPHRRSYAELVERSNRFARAIGALGLGCQIERRHLAAYESGQSHLALYLYNGPEYLEALVGAFAARVAPFNVNYRYVEHELVQLLSEQQASGVVFHSEFAPTVDRLRRQLPRLTVFVQVDDGSGNGLLPGAVWYEAALAAATAQRPDLGASPDDLYILCTGGTTGMPKGVLWRQADLFVGALQGASTRLQREYASIAEIVDEAIGRGGRFRTMATAPFMHGAGQWSALTALTHGNTCVLPTEVRTLDPVDVWHTVERERVTMLQVVGDAIVRPLLDEFDRGSYDVSSLRYVVNGGATLSEHAKQRLFERLAGVTLTDGLGTSESGAIATANSSTATPPSGSERQSVFEPRPGVVLLSDDQTRRLHPGDDELGWIAASGRMPLGYLGDPDRTARTFVEVAGVRYAIVGDRGVYRADGRIELRGRDSVTINSGGEKIFAEEVEQAILAHEGVADVVVCGRPSPRWGSEVVAIVALRAGIELGADELLATAGQRIARYKLPKAFVFRDSIARSPAGKADYRWAQRQAAGEPDAE
ncbi:MAG TPA: acyl-CoA synthetase [Ilumatobacter sp.]|nr:acyl-CoA synthetase [Ilumatobacter sp.]